MYGSDLCVEGVGMGVRRGKKQMPPIPHLRFSPLLDPLKARSSPAMPDLAPPRAPPALKLKFGKVGAALRPLRPRLSRSARWRQSGRRARPFPVTYGNPPSHLPPREAHPPQLR